MYVCQPPLLPTCLPKPRRLGKEHCPVNVWLLPYQEKQGEFTDVSKPNQFPQVCMLVLSFIQQLLTDRLPTDYQALFYALEGMQ